MKRIFLSAGMLFVFACSLLKPASPVPAPTDTRNPVVPATETREVFTPTAAGDPIEYVNPERYRVESTAIVINGGFTLTDLQVYQPKPVDWDEQKNVAIEEVSPSGAVVGREPQTGSEMYYWHLKNTPAWGKSQALKYRFTFTAFETRTAVDPALVRPYNTLSTEFRLYTKPEPYVESADPRITALAEQIAGGETNPYLLARRIYDYVVKNARYQLVGKGLLGAKALLDNGVGECGDYSALFIALARAKKIPARAVVGFWAISGDQSHVWAEFFLEGIGWIPVDPTVGQNEPYKNGIQEYYFGNMDNQRVILSKGFNIKLDPPAPEGTVASLLQVPWWWYWGTGGDASKVTLETIWRVTPN